MRVFHKCARTQIADGLVMTQSYDRNPNSLLYYPKSSALSECLSLSLCLPPLSLFGWHVESHSHFRILVLYFTQEWYYIKLFLSSIILLFPAPSLSNHLPISQWSDDLWRFFIELDRCCVGLLTSLNWHLMAHKYQILKNAKTDRAREKCKMVRLMWDKCTQRKREDIIAVAYPSPECNAGLN